MCVVYIAFAEDWPGIWRKKRLIENQTIYLCYIEAIHVYVDVFSLLLFYTSFIHIIYIYVYVYCPVSASATLCVGGVHLFFLVPIVF